MPEKDDLQSILSELQKVLSDLTKEEKQQVEDKLKERINPANLESPAPPVPEAPKSSSEKPRIEAEFPGLRQTEKINAPEAQPAAPPPAGISVPQPPRVELGKKPAVSGFPPPLPFTGQISPPAPAVPSQASAPAVPFAAPVPPAVQVKPPETIFPVQPVPVAPVPPAAAPAPVVQVDYHKDSEVPPEAIPENALLIKYLVLYPALKPEIVETFERNILDVVKKTSKKPFFLKRALKGSVNTDLIDWESVIRKCRDEGAGAAFFTHQEKMDTTDIREKFSASGIFFQSIQISQLEKRITYVDLVIELMLANKGE